MAGRHEGRLRGLEVGIGVATLTGSTIAYLTNVADLEVISLVLGGVAFGITLARHEPPE
jgi:hypothetical protein